MTAIAKEVRQRERPGRTLGSIESTGELVL